MPAARELLNRLATLEKGLSEGDFWIDGYYVGSAGERGSREVVEQYIRA